MYHIQALHEVQDCTILVLEQDLFIELFFFFLSAFPTI